MPAGTTNKVLSMDYFTSGAAFTADGRLLALKAYWDIALFEVNTWKPLGKLKGHGHLIAAMAFAPDGKTLASVSFDGSLRLWSVPARAEVAVLWDHVDSATTVAFTPISMAHLGRPRQDTQASAHPEL
jgi:WD40 repeat protein